jgi:hypothetical protein
MVDKQITQRVKPELFEQVQKAIEQLHQEGKEISYVSLAHELGVARSTLYRNEPVRHLVMAAKQYLSIKASDIVSLKHEVREMRQILEEVRTKLDELANRKQEGIR